MHPFPWPKDVLPQIRKLTLFVRFFRPLDRSSQLYEFSPEFHYYSALRKLTGLSSIRICMSYVCVPDEDYDLRYVMAWNQWDRIWLAQSLLHLLTFIPKDATFTFFEQDDKSISATLMRGITNWLQDQRVQEKQRNIKKALCSAEIDEDGELQIYSV